MNSNIVTQTKAVAVAARTYDPELENIMRDFEISHGEVALKDAQHFAKRNQPYALHDSLGPYISNIKAECEKLGAIVFHHLQPDAHLPEAKWDEEYYKAKEAEKDEELGKKETEKHNYEYRLGTFDPHLQKQIRLVLIVTGGIALGDAVFTSMSFQAFGENLLFALMLAIVSSACVFFVSHTVAHHYKKAKTKLKKRMIAIGTLVSVTIFFSALAILRSVFLESQDIHISPVMFVIISLFFFLASTLVSYHYLPTFDEIKKNREQMKIYRTIQKCDEEINHLKDQKAEIQRIATESRKQRARLVYHAKYALEICRKIFSVLVGKFTKENLIYRTDGKVPVCYSDPLPELDIPEISFLKNVSKKQ
jgi:cation transport ATPase